MLLPYAAARRFCLFGKRNTYTQYVVKAGKERDSAMLRDTHTGVSAEFALAAAVSGKL